MLCKFQVATSRCFFNMRNDISDGIGEKLLQTKAAPIALLNLSITHWSLSENMTQVQIQMFLCKATDPQYCLKCCQIIHIIFSIVSNAAIRFRIFSSFSGFLLEKQCFQCCTTKGFHKNCCSNSTYLPLYLRLYYSYNASVGGINLRKLRSEKLKFWTDLHDTAELS